MQVVLIALIVWVAVSLPIAISVGAAMNVRTIRVARRRANQRNVIDLTAPTDTFGVTDAIDVAEPSYRDEPCPTVPAAVLGPPSPAVPRNEPRSPVGRDA